MSFSNPGRSSYQQRTFRGATFLNRLRIGETSRSKFSLETELSTLITTPLILLQVVLCLLLALSR